MQSSLTTTEVDSEKGLRKGEEEPEEALGLVALGDGVGSPTLTELSDVPAIDDLLKSVRVPRLSEPEIVSGAEEEEVAEVAISISSFLGEVPVSGVSAVEGRKLVARETGRDFGTMAMAEPVDFLTFSPSLLLLLVFSVLLLLLLRG